MEPLFGFLLRHLASSLRLSVCLTVCHAFPLLASSYRLSISVSFSTWCPHYYFFFVWTCAVFTRAIPPIPFLPLLLRSFHLRQPVLSVSSCFSGVIWGLPLNSFPRLKPLSCPVVNPLHLLPLIFSGFVFKSVTFKQLSFHLRSDEALGLAGNMLDKSMILYRGLAVKLRSKSEKALFKSEDFKVGGRPPQLQGRLSEWRLVIALVIKRRSHGIDEMCVMWLKRWWGISLFFSHPQSKTNTLLRTGFFLKCILVSCRTAMIFWFCTWRIMKRTRCQKRFIVFNTPHQEGLSISKV